ncbi:MAG: class I SAM-dependent RNA methyltransferase [Pyrinomonadaceae bacterium]
MENKYSINDLIEVKIEKIVPRGFGLAFAENLTIFVALAAVGDRLRVRLSEIKGKLAYAEIESVIEPSANRVEPPCEYFGTCGGCDFQQMNYAAQLVAKVGIIRDCLHRIAKIEYEKEIPIIPSPSEFGYRMRAQWHAETASKKIGYYQRNSRDLVDIEKCIVLAPELNAELSAMRNEIPWGTIAGGRFQIDAAVGSDGGVSLNSDEFVEPAGEIDFSVCGETFRFSARSFFQGNPYLIDKLIETAIGDASGTNALDLYCGVGLFTVPLARKFKHVIGVEDNQNAVEFAMTNALLAELANVEFRAENVRQYLANVVESDLDFVLLDPPRAGTEKDTIRNLIRLAPKQISYAACEPSVLARDLRRFVDSGYKIDSITALDMFPQTHHVETVVRMHKPARKQGRNRNLNLRS